LIISGLAAWIVFAPGDTWLGRDVHTRLGLDLQGGTQVLLKAQDPNVPREVMQTAQQVVDRRVNGLGLSETLVQLSGKDRIIIELPGVTNPDQVSETLRGTGKLEFIANVDGSGFAPQGAPAEGSVVRTSGSPNPRPRASTSPTSTAVLSDTAQAEVTGPIYKSITDGKDLDTTKIAPRFGNSQTPGQNPFAVSFAFNNESASSLETFTSQNVGKLMCIVLDNTINSCATIQSALIGGSGEISTATRAEAERLFTQLKYVRSQSRSRSSRAAPFRPLCARIPFPPAFWLVRSAW